MAVRKAAGCIIVVLLVYCCVKPPLPLGVFQHFGIDLLSPTHQIVRRSTLPNSTEYEVELVVEVLDLAQLRVFVAFLNLPVILTNTTQITSVNITTECSPTPGGRQCTCRDNYAFSSNNCQSGSACDPIIGGRCGCISGIPADGRYCELNTSSPATPSTTTVVTPTKAETMPTKPETTPTEAKTTPTKPKTTPTKANTAAAKTEEKLNVTLNIEFKDSYNDPTNDFHQDVLNTIETEFQKIDPGAQVRNLTFRSGSTIADYTVEAAFPDRNVIETVENGLIRELGKTYAVIFDSPEPLDFRPAKVFSGKTVTATCGPPSANLDFTSGWTAKWSLNNVDIQEDAEHRFTFQNNVSNLTILKTFRTDVGNYECRLTSANNSVFRQRLTFQLTDAPRIQVSPVLQKVACDREVTVDLKCEVQSPYTVRFTHNKTEATEVTYLFRVEDCGTPTNRFTCEVVKHPEFTRDITVEITREEFTCKVEDDPVFGNGLLNDVGRAPCAENEDGEITAVCNSSGMWGSREDTCVLKVINDLLEQSEIVNSITLPTFLEEVREQVESLSDEVSESANNIDATVEILQNIGELASSGNISLDKTTMEDFLRTSSVLTDDKAKLSWEELNTKTDTTLTRTRRSVTPTNESTSSLFLFSIESVTRVLTNDSFSISTDNILLDKTTYTDTYSEDFNSTVEIDLQESSGETHSLTVINFASMDNVLPVRATSSASKAEQVINGNVVIVQSSGSVDGIALTFDERNTSLGRPQCVFWNFSLFDRFGGWDDQGCEMVATVNGTVTCNCSHLTAFSMLMSPSAPDNLFLEIMTYIGVAISIASLVICLIIEAYAWKRMKLKDLTYLRHVCIVNIAVSLLIANIWFIIGAAVSESAVTTKGTCSAVTFFIHLFYLALFFWMLLFGLLLIKSMVSVFDTGSSKRSKLAIGFSLGYGAPLLIAVITIAVTAPNDEYTAGAKACWLNFFQSKALLAFVVPALTIVAINLVILIYVLFKMLVSRKRDLGNSARAQQQSDIVVIVRTVAVLSPFFGLTWSLGVGTMVEPTNFGIHAAFAFFNSLQGFFILVFGTLWDKKVRKEIGLSSRSSMSNTRNTTSGTSSSGLLGRLRRRGGDGYHVSTSNSSGNT
ncbi:adhesion G protein-coupled receptor F5-like isoform X2 [Synchiropus splendidus]|uniref:adhesion G protein-coupled receptor F5-like isoform X2 n=1 Tax=Synchiropus splendidus TaxID=270530 RepID=UPI00237D46B7|nr:adhesion G protein-coupled receptor F5-like isoform X2 [Synchiropus splendidus]